MIAVIFEVEAHEGREHDYLAIAGSLRPLVEGIDGFLSVERFQSLSDPRKILSLSLWRDEEAVRAWRNVPAHRQAQDTGRRELFADYRLRIAKVVRDYGMNDREQAPDGR